MLDISYWLNVASTVSSRAEDKDFLAKEYANPSLPVDLYE